MANEQAAFKKLLFQFEQAWQKGVPPPIEKFLPPASASGSGRRKLLEELLQIDLEHRWRRAGKLDSPDRWASSRPRLEDYIARYPELGPWDQLSLELITQEYTVRQCWGDRPDHAEYVARFPQHGAALSRALAQADAELAAEPVRGRREKPRPAARASEEVVQPGPLSSLASVLDQLRRHPFLGPAQWKEFGWQPMGRFQDARSLLHDLVQRDWLTPYQANQLLQGRGEELVVGPYLILEQLGEGGTGQVFKARHGKLGRLAALKVIRKELLADPDVVARFYREVQLVAQLDHPNVVRGYDAGPIPMLSEHRRDDGSAPTAAHFLAMEYVEGMDLGRMIKQHGPLPVEQACAYVRQAALGLQYAHEQGLVHRDIKPHNLLLSVRESVVKLADLGLARLRGAVNAELTAVLSASHSTGTLTPENAVLIGTADYLAPEQALDFHQADTRADIYSLGCTFYFLLTGQPPFAGGMLAQKLLRHQQAEPPALSTLRSDVPAAVNAVLRKMLAKRPEDRYQTPGEFAVALADLETGSSGAGAKGAVATRATGRRRFIRCCAALMLGSAAAGALWYVWQPRSGPVGSVSPRDTAAANGWSSLDRLDARLIPAVLRPPDSPAELVAVLGSTGDPSTSAVRALACRSSGVLVYVDNPGRVRLWDLGNPDPRPHEPAAISVYPTTSALAMAGTRLASADTDHNVRVWDLGPGKPQVRGSPLKHDALAGALAFRPDGAGLAVGGRDQTVWLWDCSRPEATLLAKWSTAGKCVVEALAFSPDGRQLAYGGSWGRNAVHVRDVTRPDGSANEWELNGHRQDVRAMGFAPDGRALASAGRDRSVRIWDAPGGLERHCCEGHAAPVVALAFAPQGQSLASGDEEGRIILWNPSTGKKMREWRFGGEQGCKSLAFAPDGRHLLVGMANGFVFVLRLAAPGS